MKKNIIVFSAIMIAFIVFLIIMHPPNKRASANDYTCTECGRQISDGDAFLKYYVDDGVNIQLCLTCLNTFIDYTRKEKNDDKRVFHCLGCGKELTTSVINYTNYIFYDIDGDDLDFYICDDCLFEARETTF